MSNVDSGFSFRNSTLRLSVLTRRAVIAARSQVKKFTLVHGVPLGSGGLGVQSANALVGLKSAGTVVALGPRAVDSGAVKDSSYQVEFVESPEFIASWRRRYTPLRWAHGKLQEQFCLSLGHWAVRHLDAQQPDCCYAFTQVALETLKWAKRNGVVAVLESPNGHIRNFRDVYVRETRKWCGAKYRGHPTMKMVNRVEEEYRLADRIRVSSEWAKASLIAGGVSAEKIDVLQQPVDLIRYQPRQSVGDASEGPLRVCFVGSLDLRKGFVYLLDAMRLIGSDKVQLEIVGATGDRCSAKLFARASAGLDVRAAVGDPIPAYARAELFVLPTLEDGSPFAVAEAMACGLPVIVTDECGSAEWVEEGISGWIAEAGDANSLAQKLTEAIRRRPNLSTMGKRSRLYTEARAGEAPINEMANWIISTVKEH